MRNTEHGPQQQQRQQRANSKSTHPVTAPTGTSGTPVAVLPNTKPRTSLSRNPTTKNTEKEKRCCKSLSQWCECMEEGCTSRERCPKCIMGTSALHRAMGARSPRTSTRERERPVRFRPTNRRSRSTSYAPASVDQARRAGTMHSGHEAVNAPTVLLRKFGMPLLEILAPFATLLRLACRTGQSKNLPARGRPQSHLRLCVEQARKGRGPLVGLLSGWRSGT
jgi:hypothetical protein